MKDIEIIWKDTWQRVDMGRTKYGTVGLTPNITAEAEITHEGGEWYWAVSIVVTLNVAVSASGHLTDVGPMDADSEDEAKALCAQWVTELVDRFVALPKPPASPDNYGPADTGPTRPAPESVVDRTIRANVDLYASVLRSRVTEALDGMVAEIKRLAVSEQGEAELVLAELHRMADTEETRVGPIQERASLRETIRAARDNVLDAKGKPKTDEELRQEYMARIRRNNPPPRMGPPKPGDDSEPR